MSTGVESFSNIDELGAIYPMVGSEWLLWILGVAFLVGCIIWRMTTEKHEHEEILKCAREKSEK